MRWLKTFNESLKNQKDISRTEINKLRQLDDFDFFRTESLGFFIIFGKRKFLPMSFIIKKYISGNFTLSIIGESEFEFENIDELKKFLSEYEWYDIKH